MQQHNQPQFEGLAPENRTPEQRGIKRSIAELRGEVARLEKLQKQLAQNQSRSGNPQVDLKASRDLADADRALAEVQTTLSMRMKQDQMKTASEMISKEWKDLQDRITSRIAAANKNIQSAQKELQNLGAVGRVIGRATGAVRGIRLSIDADQKSLKSLQELQRRVDRTVRNSSGNAVDLQAFWKELGLTRPDYAVANAQLESSRSINFLRRPQEREKTQVAEKEIVEEEIDTKSASATPVVEQVPTPVVRPVPQPTVSDPPSLIPSPDDQNHSLPPFDGVMPDVIPVDPEPVALQEEKEAADWLATLRSDVQTQYPQLSVELTGNQLVMSAEGCSLTYSIEAGQDGTFIRTQRAFPGGTGGFDGRFPWEGVRANPQRFRTDNINALFRDVSSARDEAAKAKVEKARQEKVKTENAERQTKIPTNAQRRAEAIQRAIKESATTRRIIDERVPYEVAGPNGPVMLIDESRVMQKALASITLPAGMTGTLDRDERVTLRYEGRQLSVSMVSLSAGQGIDTTTAAIKRMTQNVKLSGEIGAKVTKMRAEMVAKTAFNPATSRVNGERLAKARGVTPGNVESFVQSYILTDRVSAALASSPLPNHVQHLYGTRIQYRGRQMDVNCDSVSDATLAKTLIEAARSFQETVRKGQTPEERAKWEKSEAEIDAQEAFLKDFDDVVRSTPLLGDAFILDTEQYREEGWVRMRFGNRGYRNIELTASYRLLRSAQGTPEAEEYRARIRRALQEECQHDDFLEPLGAEMPLLR